MLRAGLIGGQICQIDLSLISRGELDLSFLSCLSDSLKSKFVIGDVHTMLRFEFSDQELLEYEIKVFSSKCCVAICCFYFENASRDLKNRNVECSTAEIVHSDHFSIRLVKTECKGCCRWLVDDSLDL